jgi:hypothetical protein
MPKIHKAIRVSLTSYVSSLLNGAKASVSGMGNGISSSLYEKTASNKPTVCCLINIL